MNKARAASLALATPDPSLFDAVPPPGAHRAVTRASDRRVHARLTPVELQSPITARLKYGEPVTLVDLSESGALLETSTLLRPDTDLVLELLDSRTRDVTDVVSRVLRSQVAGLQGGIKYRGACLFERPFSHPALTVPHPPRPTSADDFLQLELALKTIVERFFRRSMVSGGAGHWGDGSTLLDALIRLRAAAERSDTPIDRQIAQLLAATIPGLQRNDSVESVMGQLHDHLSRHLPVLSIRTESPGYTPPHDRERVTLNMCTGAGDPPVAVTAEFAPGFGLDASQFRLLKASAYLVGLVGNWCPSSPAPGRRQPSVAEATGDCQPATTMDQDLPVGWQRMVVRRRPTDARVLERFSCRSGAPALVSQGHLLGRGAAPHADDAVEGRVLREGFAGPSGSRGQQHIRSPAARSQGRGYLSRRRGDDRVHSELQAGRARVLPPASQFTGQQHPHLRRERCDSPHAIPVSVVAPTSVYTRQQ